MAEIHLSLCVASQQCISKSLLMDRDRQTVAHNIVKCYVHGYLLVRADSLALNASLCQCCDDCIIATVHSDFIVSAFGCPGAQCLYHEEHFSHVVVLSLWVLRAHSTEEQGQCVYGGQSVSWSEE
jgi:hypothetical protein